MIAVLTMLGVWILVVLAYLIHEQLITINERLESK